MNYEVNMQNAKKLSRWVNGALIAYVAVMLIFYAYFDIRFMVYHSIGTLIVYFAAFFVIEKEWLDVYVWIVYGLITLYMGVATVCLGYDYGFHLYSMSLIPIIFHTEYMARQLGTRSPKPFAVSAFIVFGYVACVCYAATQGAFYTVSREVAGSVLAFNSVSVFGFLVIYMNMLINMVSASEEKLRQMAHTDRLTGLFNRHYMIRHLEEKKNHLDAQNWVAMIDIDNFKKINDTFGHNCGDYVLIHLSELLCEKCEGCTIARWGGEEFLISDKTPSDKPELLLENLRSCVEEERFEYEGKQVLVTVTIGVAYFSEGQSLDTWIQAADEKLYLGKNGGKNRVVS